MGFGGDMPASEQAPLFMGGEASVSCPFLFYRVRANRNQLLYFVSYRASLRVTTWGLVVMLVQLVRSRGNSYHGTYPACLSGSVVRFPVL